MGLINFLASYWWVWCILTICSFGIFFTNMLLAPVARDAIHEAAKTAADDAGFADGVRAAREVVKKRQREINKQAGSLVTDLANIGGKVFGILLMVGGLLRLFGFGA